MRTPWLLLCSPSLANPKVAAGWYCTALRMIDFAVVKHRSLSRGPIPISLCCITGSPSAKDDSVRKATEAPNPFSPSGSFTLGHSMISASLESSLRIVDRPGAGVNAGVGDGPISIDLSKDGSMHGGSVHGGSVHGGSVHGDSMQGGSAHVRFTSPPPQLVSHQRPLRILCVDGGGSKGTAAATILQAIERVSGQPLHEMFDLIVGTSIGSCLATSIALQQPMSTPIKWMEYLSYKSDAEANAGKGVFARASNISLLQTGSRISAKHCEHLLRYCCREACNAIGAKFEDPIQPATEPAPAWASEQQKHEWRESDGRAADGRQRPVTPYLCTVTAKMEKGGEILPWVNTNYSREGAFSYAGANDWTAFELIRASSAAPTYFPAFVHPKHGGTYIDGAVVANNPAKVALSEAHALFPGRPIGCFVSIGCGKETKNEDEEVGTDKYAAC